MAAPIANIMGTDVECCEIEASVNTGFEEMAKEEVLEKFGAVATTSRGKINFPMPISDAKKILQLCCVDNLSVIIKHFEQFAFADKLEDTLQQFEDVVPQADWERGLKVWAQFSDFPRPVSTIPVAERPQQVDASGDKRNDTTADVGTAKEVEVTGGGDSTDVTKETPESGSREGTPDTKVAKLDPNRELSFRATCYRSGAKHIFESPQAARSFGGALQDYFNWKVDLSNFDLEAVLTIQNRHVYVSIMLTKQSLHRRNIANFGPTTLRPTIAYGMLRMCHIGPGELVCDPMCGGGSIPIEAAINWPDARHICGDSHELAAPRAGNNIAALNKKAKHSSNRRLAVDIFRWDVRRLPLRENTVDVFITDLPFGKRSGSKVDNRRLYPQALTEMARVSRLTSGRACFLTHDRRSFIQALSSVKSLWKQTGTVATNIGGLAAAVFLLHRTGAAVNSIGHRKKKPTKATETVASPIVTADTDTQ